MPPDLLEDLEDVDGQEAVAEGERFRAEQRKYQQEGKAKLAELGRPQKEAQEAGSAIRKRAEAKAKELAREVDGSKEGARRGKTVEQEGSR